MGIHVLGQPLQVQRLFFTEALLEQPRQVRAWRLVFQGLVPAAHGGHPQHAGQQIPGALFFGDFLLQGAQALQQQAAIDACFQACLALLQRQAPA